MNTHFLQFYKQINDFKIKNSMDSLYWLYSIENIIVEVGGINKRFLKVYLFNRQFNENHNLMQMKLNFHEKEIIIQHFKIAHEYNNPNIMGFVQEIDITDDSKDVNIISYVVDGVEVILYEKYIDHIEFNTDAHKLNLVQDVILPNVKAVNMVPVITQQYWLCYCGQVNATDKCVCPVCSAKKEHIIELCTMDGRDIFLNSVNERIHINSLESLDKQIQKFLSLCEARYNIKKEDILKHINKQTLIKRQQDAIEKSIVNFIKDNTISFDDTKTFDENLDYYATPLCNDLITAEMIIAKLDLEQLRGSFNEVIRISEARKKEKKKKIILSGAITSILVLAVVLGSIYLIPEKEASAQKTPLNSNVQPQQKEAEVFKNTIHQNIYAGTYVSIGIHKDGELISTKIRDSKYESGQSEFYNWKDIVQIVSEQYHTVGLKSDGTLVSTELNTADNNAGQTNVNGWENIKQISAGTYHTVGLKKDGTVISTRITNSKYDFGQTEVEGWSDIIQVVAAWDHTIGLKSDGTVVATSISDVDYDYGEANVGNWTDIISIAGGANHTLGLKKDGTVLSTGYSGDGRCDVEAWQDIVAISAGRFHSLGLKSDGTVVSTERMDEKGNFGQDKVQSWRNVEQISAGWFHSVAMKKDGSVVSTSITKENENMGQDEINAWKLK